MQERFRTAASTLPPVLRFFCLWTVLLTVASFLSIAFCRYILHWAGYPYGAYLLPKAGDYVDLTMFYQLFQHFHSTEFFADGQYKYLYPAPVAPLYKLFYFFPHYTYVFLVFILCIACALGALLARTLVCRGVSRYGAITFALISVVFSYPIYFVFNRANMEIFVWLFSAVGIYMVLRNKSWLGAALIGVSASMKLFPFIYFALLLARRQYRQAVFGAVAAGVVTLASLWAVCPNLRVAITGIRSGLHGFTESYVLHYRPLEIGVDHSFFGMIKRFVGVLPPNGYKPILSAYLLLATVVGTVVWFRYIRHLPTINQVLCLAIACILIPPTSYDYTLLHLYTPWALLVLFSVEAQRAGRPAIPGLTAVFACFAILLSQVGEFIFHGERLGGQIKALTLIILFVLALRFPFTDSQNATEA